MVMIILYFFYGLIIFFLFYNVVLWYDIFGSVRGIVSELYFYFIFDGFSIWLGEWVVKILKYIFFLWEVIMSKNKVGSWVVIFKNIDDSIEVWYYVFVRMGYDSVEFLEVGLWMMMKVFEICGGMFENKDGDVEWYLL